MTEQEKLYFKALLEMPTQDGLLAILEKKDKQLARYHDLQSPFRQGFLLAESLVREWAKKHYPTKTVTPSNEDKN